MKRDLLAHGLGGAKDLPISPELAIAGAVAALVVSFTVLAVAWRTPRYDQRPGRPAPARLAAVVDSTWFTVALRTLGMLFFGYFLFAAVFGQNLILNPALGMFNVLLWVGIVPLSLAFGPAWKALSPLRTLHLGLSRLVGSDPQDGLRHYPEGLGYWPAAIGLYAFVWLELVYQDSTQLSVVLLWVAIYCAVLIFGSALFGNTFFTYADPFEVYSTLVGKLSVWGRRDHLLVIRSPLANLSTIQARPGLVAVVAVLFGSTGFDSFRESPPWLQYVQSSQISATLLANLALLTFCVGVGLVFGAATAAVGVKGLDRRELPGLFAHSMIPIIVGYVAAHYLSYLVEYGQVTLILMSDPLSQGDNWFGTADWQVNRWLSYHPTTLANIKVLGVVLGHVLGVVAAHDRAIKLLPPRHQLTAQLPLLMAMVGFTAGGLYLLFAA